MEQQANKGAPVDAGTADPVTSTGVMPQNGTERRGTGNNSQEAAQPGMPTDMNAAAADAQSATPDAQATEPPPAMPYTLPPGYISDPFGRVFFVGQGLRRAANGGVCPVYPDMPPGYPPGGYMAAPFMQGPPPVYVQQPTPEQIAAQQALEQQRYNQIMQCVQQFAAGEATVSDVVKTLYANTADQNQMWKGVVVGAAAAILLASEPVRQAMGQTIGSLFPGLLGAKQGEAGEETKAAGEE